MVMTKAKDKTAGPVGTSVPRIDVLEKVTGPQFIPMIYSSAMVYSMLG